FFTSKQADHVCRSPLAGRQVNDGRLMGFLEAPRIDKIICKIFVGRIRLSKMQIRGNTYSQARWTT
ncbi:hypothetical protein, partial [Xanthomonas populi]|uniref:hypothetical protein n=1 Tax=Xanthomonas populi TaxID=53414 RepID=UPI001ABF7F5C